MILPDDECLFFSIRHFILLRSLLVWIVGLSAEDKDRESPRSSVLQHISAMPLTYEGLGLYSTCHHTHSWHGQDAAELHVVLATTGKWIAAEVLAAFSKSEGSDEINESVELLAKDSIHKSRSKKFLPVSYGNKISTADPVLFGYLIP